MKIYVEFFDNCGLFVVFIGVLVVDFFVVYWYFSVGFRLGVNWWYFWFCLFGVFFGCFRIGVEWWVDYSDLIVVGWVSKWFGSGFGDGVWSIVCGFW